MNAEERLQALRTHLLKTEQLTSSLTADMRADASVPGRLAMIITEEVLPRLWEATFAVEVAIRTTPTHEEPERVT